jgi:hypothetical protein
MSKREKTRGIFLVFLWIMYCAQAHCNSRKSIECDWLSISNSAQKIIVQDYVNALDSFALAMPIIGGDTESTWAADTVHVMAKRVKEGQRSFLESMADIYLMQSYIAYGISYFNAVVGLPHDTQKLCNFVLKDMLASSDSLHRAIIANDYKGIETWNELRFESILNMQLFYTLNGMNNQPTYTDPDLGYSVRCEMIIDSLINKEELTDKEIFQASCFLESSSFFKMIVPLIILFDGSSGLVTKNKDYITEVAHYFDVRTNPIFDYYYDGKEIQYLSDKDFEEYNAESNEIQSRLAEDCNARNTGNENYYSIKIPANHE